MVSKTEFYQKSSGNSGQFVDRWYLIHADDGTYDVEYCWINKKGPGRRDIEGSIRYSLEDTYLKAPPEAIEALKRELDM